MLDWSPDGQSLAMAGLLNNNIRAEKNVTPLLGDIPVLGALFRSVRYQRKETELVILVTPHIVAPLNPGEVPELPGEHWRNPTESDLFLMQDIGGPAAKPKPKTAANAPAGSWGKVALNKGDTKGAIDAFNKVVEVDPTSPEAAQAKAVVEQLKK